jgi:type VI secretion system protein ImpM
MTWPRAILFGKLSSHGDFVTRGLEADRELAWDTWLSGALREANQRLGDGFAAAHDAAPPWRFVSGPGRLGAGWRAGALAASIDAVGRRFFFLLAIDGLADREAAARGEWIAETMEDLIYRAFEAGWTSDSVIDAARGAMKESATVASDSVRPPHERWWTWGGPQAAPLALDAPPVQLVGALAASRIAS